MTREKLVEAMKVQGLLSKFSKHELWEQAFSLYAQANPKDPVSTKCGLCYGKVKKWLER